MTDRRLTIGDRAPEFVLLAARGEDVAKTSLQHLLEGHRGLVLTTYSLGFTGGRGSQVSRFRDAYDEFRRHGVEVAAASVDSSYSHHAWAAELDIQYPLLSDFGRELITGYGIPARDIPLLPGVASRSPSSSMQAASCGTPGMTRREAASLQSKRSWRRRGTYWNHV